MRNLTICMHEDRAIGARVEAVRGRQSVSSWVGPQLVRIRGGVSDFETDLVAILQTPRTAMSDGGRTFNREEIYDRPVMKRFR